MNLRLEQPLSMLYQWRKLGRSTCAPFCHTGIFNCWSIRVEFCSHVLTERKLSHPVIHEALVSAYRNFIVSIAIA